MSKDVNIMFWLILAVDNRKQVKIKYDTDSGYRVIEPFVIGQNEKKEIMLRAFDLSKNDWRLFDVGKIKEIQNTSKRFTGFRPGYNQGKDKGMVKVLRRVR